MNRGEAEGRNAGNADLPRSSADVGLDAHDPLLVEKGMRLPDDLVDSVPGSFWLDCQPVMNHES